MVQKIDFSFIPLEKTLIDDNSVFEFFEKFGFEF